MNIISFLKISRRFAKKVGRILLSFESLFITLDMLRRIDDSFRSRCLMSSKLVSSILSYDQEFIMAILVVVLIQGFEGLAGFFG